MAGSHRKSYSLKIVSAAVAAACSATFTVSLHAQQSAADQQLPEVRVREFKDEGFVVKEAPGVSRSDLPLRDIPASIKVVPRAVIDEQQALRLEQAVKNVSGVIFSDGGEGTNFSSRGFGITTLRDGFRRTEFTEGDLNRADQDTYNVERIEVLKGPASALFVTGFCVWYYKRARVRATSDSIAFPKTKTPNRRRASFDLTRRSVLETRSGQTNPRSPRTEIVRGGDS